MGLGPSMKTSCRLAGGALNRIFRTCLYTVQTFSFVGAVQPTDVETMSKQTNFRKYLTNSNLVNYVFNIQEPDELFNLKPSESCGDIQPSESCLAIYPSESCGHIQPVAWSLLFCYFCLQRFSLERGETVFLHLKINMYF